MTDYLALRRGLATLLLIGGSIGVSAEPLGAADCGGLDGSALQGGLLWGRAATSSGVTWNDRPVSVLPDGSFVLGVGRDARSPGLLSIDGEAPCEVSVEIGQRTYRIQRVEGVPQQTVTPPEEVLERIARERELVRQAKSQRLQRPDLLAAVRAGLRWPVTGRISGVYGSQRVYNGTPGSPHYGVDVARPTGHPVVAPGPGIITLAEPDLFYSGGTVILDHGFGLSSSFLHLSEVSVAVGEEVSAGALIGKVGATGRATGPHLDWRMSWLDQRIDPQLLVPPMPTDQ